jgi:hypothetical protein
MATLAGNRILSQSGPEREQKKIRPFVFQKVHSLVKRNPTSVCVCNQYILSRETALQYRYRLVRLRSRDTKGQYVEFEYICICCQKNRKIVPLYLSVITFFADAVTWPPCILRALREALFLPSTWPLALLLRLSLPP